MEQKKLILIGAGGRGNAYSKYFSVRPEEGTFLAVAEPIDSRRTLFAKTYGVPPQNCYKDWKELIATGIKADAAIICTQDNEHVEPAIASMKAGMHVLVEKPIDKDPVKCGALVKVSRETGKLCTICHVLRYTPFFNIIKNVIDSGDIGKVANLDLCENVGFWHMAHSYVRGMWRKEEETSPMIMAKSCHDMDIILYLLGKNCIKLSSMGSLLHFKEKNAPKNSTSRCVTCAAEADCPYSAKKLYLNMKITRWPVNVITEDLSYEGRLQAITEGPYGRCVYRCDNDVVDHQVSIMEFEEGVTASFTMSGFTSHGVGREIHVMGTLGEIRANMGDNVIYVTDFNTKTTKEIPVVIPEENSFGHGGGDFGITDAFMKAIRGEGETSSTVENSVQSHLMCIAAEASRLNNKVVSVKDYMDMFCK